jgi:hypothetical protein
MPGLTPVDWIASQLRESVPMGNWDASGVDRARELAAWLVGAGVRDLGGLLLLRAVETVRDASGAVVKSSDLYALQYGSGKPFGYLSRPGSKYLDGLEVGWSAEGHGGVTYVVQGGAGGFVIVPIWGSTSDAGSIREGLIMVGTFVLTFALPAAGFSIANAIGSTIVGPTLTAAYPALANAVGQAAVSTVMNGGNVADAVRGVALSYVGAEVGGFTGGAVFKATDVDLLGKLASSATAALVQGGDVKRAVGLSLITNGAKNMDDWFAMDNGPGDGGGYAPAPVTGYHDPVYDAPDVLPAAGIDYGPSPVDLIEPGPFAPLPAGSIFQTGVFPASQASGQSMMPEPVIQAPIPANGGGGSTFDASNIISTGTRAALAALQLVNAYKASRNPGLNPTARYVDPSTGAVIAASDNGLIQTQTIGGAVTSRRPPVGQPQMTTTGNIVVNNGDGTYTLIDGNGNRTVRAYAPTSSFGSGSLSSLLTPMNLAIGGAALFFLMRR